MITPVTGSTQTEATSAATKTQPAAAPTRDSQPASQNNLPVDTVHISSAASNAAAKAALQEASESQAQTVTEAQNGDQQAQRLLARETAAKQVHH